MDVELPTTGCNILTSANSFYNYSSDRRTRQTYYIYEGVAHLQSSATSQYGYDYSGTCLVTGDLVFRPEVRVYFPILAFGIVVLLTFVVYHIIIKRLLP